MAPIFIILNGKSCSHPELRAAIYCLRAEHYPLEVRVTWESGDASRYITEALKQGCQTLIAAGGDGTINEIATGLLQLPAEQRPVLGILPLGTANDFATSAGIPLDMEAALRLAIVGHVHTIDAVRVNQQAYFLNMATGGFGPRITTQTPEKLKAALGGVSYFIHGLTRMDTLTADRCEIFADDFHWQGDALVIAVGNGRQAGGGQRLCPTALVDDGLLDLSIVTSQQWLPTLVHSLTRSDENPNIIRHQAHKISLKAEHEMVFNLDGEPLQGKAFEIEVLPGVLQCRLPPHCELLT